MTEQELARALFSAGLLTQDQVQAAAAQRTADVGFADVVVRNGWVTAEQVRQVSGGAVNVGAWDTSSTAPPPPAPAYQPPAYSSTPPTYGSSGLLENGLNPNAQVKFETIGTAWGLLRAQMGTWVGAVFIFMLLVGIVQAPLYFMIFRDAMANPGNAQQSAGTSLVQMVTSIIAMLVTAFLMPGMLKMALKQIDGGEISIGDMFQGANYFGSTLAAMFLYYIAVVFGMCALCIGALVAGATLWFAFPLIVDKGLGALDALKLSWNTLKAHILVMLLYGFVVLLVSCVGYLACVIGIFFSYPLIFIAPMLVYREFFPNSNVAPRGGMTPGLGSGGGAFRAPIPDPNS